MVKLTKRELKEQRRLENQEKAKSKKRNDMLKKFGIWIGAAAVLGLSVWGLILLSNSTPDSSKDSPKAPPVTAEDIIIGSESAKLSLIEYADFQCPSCAAYHPLVSQLLNEYEGDVKLVFRNFPLRQTHKNAMKAAQAAFAADRQQKFKEMYDLLFQNQNAWAAENNPEELFVGYASEIGLDPEKFREDMNAEETRKFIEKQYSEAVNIGVSSTPTFYLNGTKINNPGNYEDFKKLIENEINKK
jgi:protein-disulfide isomerase